MNLEPDFVSGSLHGATNIKGIYDVRCNTVKALGHFIAHAAEQEALTYALELDRHYDA